MEGTITVTIIDTHAAEAEAAVVLTTEQVKVFTDLRAARDAEKGWKREKDRLTAAARSILDGAKGAVYKDRIVATVSSRAGRRSVDLDRLRVEYPEAYRACVTTGDPTEVINLP